jgi:hypothetical protein
VLGSSECVDTADGGAGGVLVVVDAPHKHREAEHGVVAKGEDPSCRLVESVRVLGLVGDEEAVLVQSDEEGGHEDRELREVPVVEPDEVLDGGQ